MCSLEGQAVPIIRIMAVDDHPVLREGIAAILGVQPDMVLVGEAESGARAAELFRTLRPDVTLMDLQMEGGDGLDAIRAIRAFDPKARIIVLTTFSGDMRAMKALKAGAAGFLTKNALRKELLAAIRAVHAGSRHLSAEVAREIAFHALDDPLSNRQVDIVRCLAAGYGNKKIAQALALSEHVVKAELKDIFAKLGVDDRTAAVTVAVQRGVIDL